MWGADYPHSEGSYPYSTEALRVAFADYAEPDVRAMVESTAARFYGFDLDLLRPIGDRIGPLVSDVAQPLAPRGMADRHNAATRSTPRRSCGRGDRARWEET